MHHVLFLCSGNYYRSRFAEICFNWLASQCDLSWQADSRGFRLSPRNVGPISLHAVEGLKARGIPMPQPDRPPMVVAEHDFDAFDIVVAVKEAEHRTMMQKRFSKRVEQIEYWQIHDIDCAEPSEALVALEGKVRELVERLRTAST